MARIFRITIDLRYVSCDAPTMEFAVVEQIRTAPKRPVCTLQIGDAMSMDDIGLLQQIVDDCVLSATGRTVGSQESLAF